MKSHRQRVYEASRAASSLSLKIKKAIARNPGPIVLARVRSKSDPRIKHDICLGADHKVFCVCDGWKFSKEEPKTCRHLKRFKEKVQPQEF